MKSDQTEDDNSSDVPSRLFLILVGLMFVLAVLGVDRNTVLVTDACAIIGYVILQRKGFI
jgi:hypothetical protein